MKPIVAMLCAALTALSWPAAAQAPRPHDVEDFIREDKFKQIAVSPKGTYVAMTVPVEDKTVLVVVKPGEGKAISRIDVRGKKSHVVKVQWVNDERLIYEVAIKDQLIENPIETGEMWAVDADGGKPKQIAGWKPVDPEYGAGRAGGEAARDTVFMDMIHDLPEDDKTMLAAVYRSGSDYTTAEKVNVYTGSRVKVAQAPVQRATLTADNAGIVRFAKGEKKDLFDKLYYRKSADADWELMNDEGVSGKVMLPIGFSADDTVAYLYSNEKTGPDSVIAYDVATGASKVVVRDAMMDPTGTINAIGKRHPIGVYFAGEKVRYEYFQPDSADAKAHRGLQKAFPGQVVLPWSRTTANNEVPISVYADREPGAVYAMNLTTRKVTPMMFAADWLQPERLAPMRDVIFEARDGRKIPGYLTVPAGSDGKNLPLVLYPHGGPHGIQDHWGFNSNAQILAAHGYAVLQVNYRGSSGYGREHVVAGYKQWGLKMQDDLTDATRWAIAQGVADPKRICIFGASYGGYAALMGAVREPDLYKCVAGQVGVYDLGRMKSEDELGNDDARRLNAQQLNSGDLTAVSPNRLASRIKAPVFLSAGHEDEIAPVEHTELMEKALKEAGVPVETLYFKTEGHGIYKLEHKREFYAKLLTFLSKHLGGRAPVVVTPPEKK